MAGGYISCGDFLGSDKTGTAIFEMLNDVEEQVTPQERKKWASVFAKPLQKQLESLDEDDLPYMELSKKMMDVLVGPLRRYYDALNAQLNHPSFDEAAEIGEWRSGEGWRLLCAHDLLEAYDVCCRTKRPVVVHFD